MTVNELKCLLNELPPEMGNLPVVGSERECTELIHGLYFGRYGSEHYSPENWDIFEWECYVAENPERQVIIII